MFIFQTLVTWVNKQPVAYQREHKYRNTTSNETLEFKRNRWGYYTQFSGFRNYSQMRLRSIQTWSPKRELFTCVAILATNLARAEWIAMNCNYKTSVVVCQHEQVVKQEQLTPLDSKFCSHDQIKKSPKCFSFVWKRVEKHTFVSPKLVVSHQGLKTLAFLFDSISEIFPPIILQSGIYSFGKKFGHLFSFKERKLLNGFAIFLTYPVKFVWQSHSNIYEETDASLMSVQFLSNCKDVESMRINNFFPGNVLPQQPDKPELCKRLKKKCPTSTTKNLSALFSWHHYLAQYSGELSVTNNTVEQYNCGNGGLLKCALHKNCFDISSICSFLLSQNLAVLPCKFGDHLQNCQNFECNAMFKCPKYYCIPWLYVCDGKWDCPHGYDEKAVCGTARNCTSMFRCHNTTACLHVSSICNGKQECLFRDDEFHCELFSVACPTRCTCVIHYMNCTATTSDVFSVSPNYPFPIVSIASSTIQPWQELIPLFFNVKFLVLKHNKLTNICPTSDHNFETLRLDFSWNLLISLQSNCIKNLAHLQVLQFQQNSLSVLQNRSLSHLPSLRTVNLSVNPITCINRAFIVVEAGNLHLAMVQIPGGIKIEKDAFCCMNLNLLQVNNYVLCCLARNSACSSQIPWYKSCEGILPSLSVRLCIAIMSSLTLFLNAVSLVFQLKSGRNLTCAGQSILSINFVDTMCGIYLGLLWVSDHFMDRHLLISDKKWLSSAACFAGFYAVLMYNILSPLLLALLTLSRYRVVVEPLSSIFKDYSFSLKLTFSTIAGTCGVCVGVTVAIKEALGNLPFGLCLPFTDPARKSDLFKYITGIIGSVQFILSVVIVIINICLVIELKKNTKALELSCQPRKPSKYVVLQVGTVSLTNVLCCVPTNSIFLYSLFVTEDTLKMLYWTTVVLMPLNSQLNPVILMWSSVRSVAKTRKGQKSQKRKWHTHF